MHELLQRLERQREQMHWLADKHQNLRHPDVVRASQMLDKLIIEVQKKNVGGTDVEHGIFGNR
jgi:hypothetical protein